MSGAKGCAGQAGDGFGGESTRVAKNGAIIGKDSRGPAAAGESMRWLVYQWKGQHSQIQRKG